MAIIATRRRPVLILHLQAKYAKIDYKNEIYAKNWVRSTWTAKVNSGKKSQRLKSTLVNGQVNSWSMMTSADAVADDVSRWRGRWRHIGLMSAEEPGACRRMSAHGGSWRRVTARGLYWRRVEARASDAENSGGAWKVRWRRNFIERQIGEITFWWCNLWSDRRSRSGGGDKAVVFDVLKSRWRHWCCSQQQLQMTPKKTRLLKSDTPKD